MSLFDSLLIAHLAADFLLQFAWMAKYKAQKSLPLLAHSFLYTLILGIAAYLATGSISLPWLLFLFITHVILDRRTFVHWWCRKIMGVNLEKQGWLAIAADQTFHLLALAVFALFS